MTDETKEQEASTVSGGQNERLVMRYGCTGTHGGINKMCDHCANNIENYGESQEEQQAWKDSFKINEALCRLPCGPNGDYWTQYIALHQDA